MNLWLHQPLWPLALIPVCVGALWVYRRRGGWGPMLRALVLASLVMALSEPMLTMDEPGQCEVSIVDVSDSVAESAVVDAIREISDNWTEPLDERRLGLVLFAETAQLHIPVGGDWDEPELESQHGEGSDIAAALELALAALPLDCPGRIHLYTDGNHTGTSLLPVLETIQIRGVGLQTTSMKTGAEDDTLSELVLNLDKVAPGATVRANLSINADKVRVDDVGFSVGGQSVDAVFVESKDAVALFDVPVPASLPRGVVRVEASTQDQLVFDHVEINTPSTVWVVRQDRRASRFLVGLLEGEGFLVKEFGPRAVPTTVDADLVVLVDVPAEGAGAVPGPFIDGLVKAVLDGTGLLVLGGDHSYDLGGWHETALADALPVEMDPDGAVKDDATTMLIVLDKSGSMSQAAVMRTETSALVSDVNASLVGGNPEGSKIQMAGTGAVAALRLLKPADYIGVLTVDTRPRWAVPLRSVKEPDAIARDILSIEAGGGGIYLATALREAVRMLRTSDTPIRHLVLFTDASDVGEQEAAEGPEPRAALDMAAELQNDDITLSVIGIGTPAARDLAFLRRLSEGGGGRFYMTNDATELPALFTQETETVLGTGLEEQMPLMVRAEDWHPALGGIDFDEVPRIDGKNRLLRRDRTRVLLASPKGDPILASGRFGLGEVFAFGADLGGRWTRSWMRWDGHERLWIQVVRQGLRSVAMAPTTVDVSKGAVPKVIVTRREGGRSIPTQQMRLRLRFDDGDEWVEPTLVQPGHWEFGLEMRAKRPFEVSAYDGSLFLNASYWVPTGAVESQTVIDEEVMATLTATEGGERSRRRLLPLWPWLTLLAVCLLPFDAWARRGASLTRSASQS